MGKLMKVWVVHESGCFFLRTKEIALKVIAGVAKCSVCVSDLEIGTQFIYFVPKISAMPFIMNSYFILWIKIRYVFEKCEIQIVKIRDYLQNIFLKFCSDSF